MVRFDNLPIIKSTFPNNEKQYDALKPASLFVNYFNDGNVNKYSFKDIRSRMEDNIYNEKIL